MWSSGACGKEQASRCSKQANISSVSRDIQSQLSQVISQAIAPALIPEALAVFGSNEMQNNVIPIRRGGEAELTKLYVHLLNAAINEAAASTSRLAPADDSIIDQALVKAQRAQVHCLTAHWKLPSAPRTGTPTQGSEKSLTQPRAQGRTRQ